ncbi:MAG: YerC/YecD family TrpR-related protein [Eubacteriales bacterium]|nr:YerC/YecD family TrpR-related protein [Eubacteriales bacterium]
MNKLKSDEIDALFEAILTLENTDECYKFFEDACTIKELRDIAQRFHVARLLRDGGNYQEINAKTGMSTATICRVNKCLNYGDGGYSTAIDRLKEKGKI